MLKLRLLLTLVLACLLSVMLSAQTPLIRSIDQSAGVSNNIVARDFDADGDLDLFVENTTKVRFEIIENLGNNQYGNPRSIYRYSVPNEKSFVADITGDDLPDIVIGGLNTNRITLLENIGSLTFVESTVLELDNNAKMDFYPSDADIDGDGYDDFLCRIDGQTNIARGSSSGLQPFEVIPIEPGTTADSDIGAADINGDGVQDLILPFNNDTLSGNHVLLQTENFTFLPPIPTEANWIINATTQFADFTGDGLLDIVYNNIGIFMLVGHGDGTFDAPISVHSGNALSLNSGDFNNDGHVDLARPYYPLGCNFPSVCDGQLYIYWNQGDGTFEHELQSSFHGSINRLYTADLTEDGFDDFMVVTNHEGLHLVESLPGNTLAPPYRMVNPVNSPRQVSSVDVDQDGLEDIVLADGGVFGSNYTLLFGGLGWYKNLGNGYYDRLTMLSSDVGFVSTFDWGDFEGDGDLDFFFSDDDNLYFLENINGEYVQTEVATNQPFNHVFMLDYNYDGQMEACGFYDGNSNGSIYQLNGMTWNTSTLPSTRTMRLPKKIDIDLDDLPEIVFYSANDDAIRALQLQEDDLPSVTTLRSGITSIPQALDVIDLNMDGNLDIISVEGDNLIWYSNPGSFPFLPAQAEESLGISSPLNFFNALAIADFDNNGLEDVVFSTNNELIFCYQNDLGEVQQEAIPRYDFIDERLGVCQSTPDGLPDVLIFEESSGVIEMQFNSATVIGCDDDTACNYLPDVEVDLSNCVYPPPFDFNCSGGFDTSDLIFFLESFGCLQECGAADLDQDGLVGITDLLLLLNAFAALNQ